MDSDGLPLEDKVEVFISGIDGCGGLFLIGMGGRGLEPAQITLCEDEASGMCRTSEVL